GLGSTLASRIGRGLLDLALPALVGAVTVGLVLGLTGTTDSKESALPFLRQLPGGLSAMLVYVLPLVICFAFAGRPVRFGLGIGAVLFASLFCKEYQSQVLYRERSFFGDLHIRHDPTGAYIQMVHGT